MFSYYKERKYVLFSLTQTDTILVYDVCTQHNQKIQMNTGEYRKYRSSQYYFHITKIQQDEDTSKRRQKKDTTTQKKAQNPPS